MEDWINVKIELPANEGWTNDHVLFIDNKDIYHLGNYDHIDLQWFDVDEQILIQNVTHWMPLPKPPTK